MSERSAFWLAPLAATLPLIPLFALPVSPWFLGRLMGDPTHPMALPGTGPWLSAAGVVFDAGILAYVMAYAVALPIYFLCKRESQMSFARLMILFCLIGVIASQVVHGLQTFRQPLLRDFASGWTSPLFGCLCGASAGLFFAFLRKLPIPEQMRPVLYAMPAFTLILCGFLLVQGATASRFINR